MFGCEIDALFSTLLEERGALWDALFSFLEAPPPLNPVLAGYFARLLCALLGRRAVQALAQLQRRPRALDLLLRHLGSASVCDALLRLVGADDGPLSGNAEAQDWLAASPLLGQLLDALGSEDAGKGAAAAELLGAIARTHPSPLAAALATPPALGRLFAGGVLAGGRGLARSLDS